MTSQQTTPIFAIQRIWETMKKANANGLTFLIFRCKSFPAGNLTSDISVADTFNERPDIEKAFDGHNLDPEKWEIVEFQEETA